MSEPKKPTIESVALYGGRAVEVLYRSGVQGVVHLRLIKASECGAFLDTMHRSEVEAYQMAVDPAKCSPASTVEIDGVPPRLAPDLDDLTDESRAEVLEANLALNFTRALAVKRREADRAAQTGAGMKDLLQGLASVLSTFAPPSPSPADSPESRS